MCSISIYNANDHTSPSFTARAVILPGRSPAARPTFRPAVRLPCHPSVRPFFRPAARLPSHPSVHPSVRLLACLVVRPFTRTVVLAPGCPSVLPSGCLPAGRPVRPSSRSIARPSSRLAVPPARPPFRSVAHPSFFPHRPAFLTFGCPSDAPSGCPGRPGPSRDTINCFIHTISPCSSSHDCGIPNIR